MPHTAACPWAEDSEAKKNPNHMGLPVAAAVEATEATEATVVPLAGTVARVVRMHIIFDAVHPLGCGRT